MAEETTSVVRTPARAMVLIIRSRVLTRHGRKGCVCMLGMGLLLNSTSVQTPVQLGESLQQSSSAEQLGASGSVPHICDAADATKRRRSAERSMAALDTEAPSSF